jgi:mono/diheme cytochrome c family protein
MRTYIFSIACLALAPQALAAQAAQAADSSITSLAGVYTAEQAAKGKETYGAACLSCHKPIEFTGEKFWNTVVGRPLFDFFKYVKSEMPQDNPGSLGDEDYASVISYIFTLNSMPAGQKAMPTDSASLSKIKVVAPAPSGSSVPTRYSLNHPTGRGK